MIGSAGYLDYFLVKQSKDYRRFTLVSDSGKRSIVLFDLVARITELAQLV